MSDVRDVVGIVALAVLALGSLIIMGLCEEHGRPIPASVAAAFGTCVGSLATSILSTPKGNGGGK